MAKRKHLSLSEKVKIIKELELPGTQASVAKKYGISSFQVSHLAKNKEDLCAFENEGNQSRKRKRESKEKEVGDALFLWFKQKLGQGIRLSGPILKKKASNLALTLGTEFSPSNGWLSHWKARHDLFFKKEHGERQDADILSAMIGNVTAFLNF